MTMTWMRLHAARLLVKMWTKQSGMESATTTTTTTTTAQASQAVENVSHSVTDTHHNNNVAQVPMANCNCSSKVPCPHSDLHSHRHASPCRCEHNWSPSFGRSAAVFPSLVSRPYEWPLDGGETWEVMSHAKAPRQQNCIVARDRCTQALGTSVTYPGIVWRHPAEARGRRP